MEKGDPVESGLEVVAPPPYAAGVWVRLDGDLDVGKRGAVVPEGS